MKHSPAALATPSAARPAIAPSWARRSGPRPWAGRRGYRSRRSSSPDSSRIGRAISSAASCRCGSSGACISWRWAARRRRWPPGSPPPAEARTTQLWPVLCRTLAENEPLLRRFLDHPPQTNEVGRSAIFLGGFLRDRGPERPAAAACTRSAPAPGSISAGTALPIAWARIAGREATPGLTLTAEWRGPAPRLDVQPVIAGRQACDRRPVDLADPEARLRLQGYVWPEQSGPARQPAGGDRLGEQDGRACRCRRRPRLGPPANWRPDPAARRW